MTALLLRLRSLRRATGFAAAAVVTLSLGIGAGTAAFSVFDHVLLAPLPYPRGDALVQVSSTRDGDEISMNYLDLQDLRESSSTLTHLVGFARTTMTLRGDGPAQRLRGLAVESSLFPTLGVAPAMGRAFRPEEDVWGTGPVVLLSHQLWQQRYGGDPDVLGRTALLNDVPHEIVGVMPPGFEFPAGIVLGASDLWVPMGTYEGITEGRDSHPGIYAVGALAEGRTADAARRELRSIAARLAQEYPEGNEGESVEVRPALEAVVGDVRAGLWIVLAASLLILLIACFNFANLLLARSASRHRELAVRNALGAGRRRIMGLVLGEGLVLAALGGVVGWAIGWALVRSSRGLLQELPRSVEVGLDPRTVAFAATLAMVAAVLGGAAPAAHGARTAAMARLRSRNPGLARLSMALVSAQVAVTLALLILAGLLGASVRNLRHADPGIRPDGVLTFRLGLPETSYDSARTALFYASLFERLEAVPGVRSAGAISTLPLSGAGAQAGIHPAEQPDSDPVRTDVAVVAHDYFATMGIRLLDGRLFAPEDAGREDVPIVVDRQFARRFWPGEDPVGRQVQGWGFHRGTVVGVVEHVKNYGVAAESREEIYFPLSHRTLRNLHVVVRTEGEPADALPAVRAVVAELDPYVPLERPRTMTEVVQATSRTDNVLALLSRAFSVAAAVLAAFGLYGLLSYTVRWRRPEIGLRMALGASARRAAGGVIRFAIALTAVGAAAGLALGLIGAFWLRSRLFGVSPVDPGSLLLATAVLLGVGLLAAAVPALRAAAVEPMEVLREE